MTWWVSVLGAIPISKAISVKVLFERLAFKMASRVIEERAAATSVMHSLMPRAA